MNWKKTTGWLIIIAILGVLFLYVTLTSSFLVALGCFGGAFLLMGLIKLAVDLIFD